MRALSVSLLPRPLYYPRCLSCPSLDSSFASVDVHSLFTSSNGFKDVIRDWSAVPQSSPLYRVAHLVDSNLPLTSKQKFCFGLARSGQARPMRNFCFDINGRFESTTCVTLCLGAAQPQYQSKCGQGMSNRLLRCT